MSPIPRVMRNDWGSVSVPDLPGWRPTMPVSVVIPAFQGQETLDLALASLSRQTYPAGLLEVVVVDDGSEPPLRLPEIRPERTTLLRVDHGWGKANALRLAVERTSGEVIHMLDADMVAYPTHVAALARWHHVLPYAVTLGYKRFVTPQVHGPWPPPEKVAQEWTEAGAARLFDGAPGEPHDYQERYIAQTDRLRLADHLAFRIHVGATVAVRRELYEAAGGPDPRLRFGNDTEFGYRLAQAGAVFIPEPLARSWHLGPTHVMRMHDEVARYRLAFVADRVPLPRHWRKVGGTAWTVPLFEVTIEVAGEPLERVRTAVDSVLRGRESDVRVSLVGPWDRLGTGRVPAFDDPLLEPRLIAATYRGEPRVRLVTQPPTSAFPAPYLLELRAGYGVAPDSLGLLAEIADRHQTGVVCVGAHHGASGAQGRGGTEGPPAVLWRTSAASRARWVREPGEPLLEAVSSVHGRRDVTADAIGLTDLRRYEPSDLVDGRADRPPTPRRPARSVPTSVEVAGLRSLARATLVVAVHGGRRLRARLRRVAVRRGQPAPPDRSPGTA